MWGSCGCIQMRIDVYAWTGTRMHVHAHAQMRMHAHSRARTRAHCTCTRTHVHAWCSPWPKHHRHHNHLARMSTLYCDFCEMWLNGPTQWEDHKIGKKHKKNLRRRDQPPKCSRNSYAGDEGNGKESPKDNLLPKKMPLILV